MACTRKWRELIAGRRWMVAGKWWCPGPCGVGVGGGGACNCFRGTLLEGNRRFWHNYTPPDNSWASGGMQYFLGQLGVIRFFYTFNPSAPFPCTLQYIWPQGGVSFGKAESSWRVVFVFLLAVLSQMTNVSFSTSISICSTRRQIKSNHVMDTIMTIIAWNLFFAATNPVLTVCDKQKIIDYVHYWLNDTMSYPLCSEFSTNHDTKNIEPGDFLSFSSSQS